MNPSRRWVARIWGGLGSIAWVAGLAWLALGPAGCGQAGAEPDGGSVDGLDRDGDGGPAGDRGPDLNPTEEDRDGDGLLDVVEDRNGNGVVDPGETDPLDADSDGDGLIDGIEDSNHNGRLDWGETDPLEADTDGDGISDGLEDRDRNGRVDPGEPDPLRADSDRDGLDDGLEDRNHNGQLDPGETDPARADTDGDGLSDGLEDRNHNGQLDPGETDPTNPDMDTDGVADGDEDRDGDGRLGQCDQPCAADAQCSGGQVCATRAGVCYSSACSKGETDPFDADTDHDGISDAREASTLVCAADRLKPVTFHALEPPDFRLALETFFEPVSILRSGAAQVGLTFSAPTHQLAGFLLNRPAAAPGAAGQEALDRAALGGLAGIGAASARALTTFDGYDAVIAEYDLTVQEASPPELAGQVAEWLAGAPLDGLLPAAGASSSAYHLSTETVARGDRVLILGALASGTTWSDEAQRIRLADVTNSTALAGYTDGTDMQCDSFLSVGMQPVDFLWVVDNSDSMGQEQAAVSAAANAMAALLSTTTLDWRVAITKSDPTQGGGLLFTPFTRDVGRFRSDMLLIGTAGAPNEYSLQMGLDAIDNSSPCAAGDQPYKLRCGALPIVIVLSDEDDQTIETASGGDNYAGPPDAATVAQLVEAYRSRSAVLFGIVGGDPKCATALNSSKGIDAVVHGVGGGSVGSICDADQSGNVSDIVRAAFGASSTYRLAEPPISSTIQVALVRQAGASPLEVPRSRTDGFDYDGVSRAILFYGDWRPVVSGLDVVASYRTFVDCQPQPEECNGRDDDCDGQTDEDFDADSDGWSVCAGDCDDSDPSVHPQAEEICNHIDDDCDGQVDEGFDLDGDGFRTCDDDCDPDDPDVFPTAWELCDGKDNDCDGETDPAWACS